MSDLCCDITPVALAAVILGHWGILGHLRLRGEPSHWVRDTSFAEVHFVVGAGHGAQVLATLSKVAVSLHRHAGAANVAARSIAHQPERLLAMIR